MRLMVCTLLLCTTMPLNSRLVMSTRRYWLCRLRRMGALNVTRRCTLICRVLRNVRTCRAWTGAPSICLKCSDVTDDAGAMCLVYATTVFRGGPEMYGRSATGPSRTSKHASGMEDEM